MTEIMVAKRSGVLRAPDGTQHRLVAGKTLADARHPGVTGSPESWRPMVVELAVDSDAPAAAGGDDERVVELEAARDHYLSTLNAISDLLVARGLLEGVDMDREGWLVGRLGELLPPGDPAEQIVVAGPADPETQEGRAEIRQWARESGIEVAESGRLPKAVVEQYRAAHGG